MSQTRKISDFAKARDDYAWDKWQQLDPKEQEWYAPAMEILMGIPKMGERGAVEFMMSLGTFLNDDLNRSPAFRSANSSDVTKR
jgi:hypothetical protein